MLDPSAAWGVPAHVTVLYPFVPPDQIDVDIIRQLASVVRGLPSVQARFHHVDWFESRVVYLAPEPDGWFRNATAAIHGAFPKCPPYGGVFDDVVPHLTIGEGKDPAVMRRAADLIKRDLPVVSPVERLLLMCGSQTAGSWRTVAELPLGGVP